MISDANPARGDDGTAPRPSAVTLLAGSAVGLLAAIGANHSAVAGFVAGGIAALVILVVLMHVQSLAWKQIAQHQYFEGD